MNDPLKLPPAEAEHLPARVGKWRTLLYALLAFALLGVALAWLLTRTPDAARGAIPSEAQAPSLPINPELQSLQARLNDAQTVNRVLREQVLALSQRMDLVEQSLAAARREQAPSAESFKLDEAQYLLSLAETRLDLFADPQSAVRALELADNLLAGIGDPGLASVRQSLSIELDVVRAAPMNDMPALSGRLRALTQELANVPVKIDASANSQGRLWAALDRYLVVRREGEAMPSIGRSPWAVREGITLEFERAQLALERQQPEIWQRSLTTALQMAEQSLVAENVSAESFLMRLKGLASTALAPEPPKIGVALRELRRLREGNRGMTMPHSQAGDLDASAVSPAMPNQTANAAPGLAPAPAVPPATPSDTPNTPTPPAEALPEPLPSTAPAPEPPSAAAPAVDYR
jgi:uroporphyrin-III C-methyltransferase